ncbi:hypothetical protein M433DRAFT_152802 [Acidomyces richmondensis BFW]|nr:MAG: hypothetical protein FE78DRAFT_88214 [Acidomyces sp. 'richmondensis']KYG46927.1 hypothetical protein M433DRAFT_152802 [Acidomyces richmondensis BFW]
MTHKVAAGGWRRRRRRWQVQQQQQQQQQQLPNAILDNALDNFSRRSEYSLSRVKVDIIKQDKDFEGCCSRSTILWKADEAG